MSGAKQAGNGATDSGNSGPAEPLGSRPDQDIVKGPAAADTTRFVRVSTAEDPFEADLIADALDEADIPVLARARRDAAMDTLVVPALPWWEILVPEEHLQRASEITAKKSAEMAAQADEAAQAAEEEEVASEQASAEKA